jgi:intracellular sulfur oxidation DsrE/DsrF family protein
MESKSQPSQVNHRRRFLGTLLTGVAALGMTSFADPRKLGGEKGMTGNSQGPSDADEWFTRIKGKHRIIFDSTGPKDIFPFAWPKVFLLTNAGTGTPEKDCSAVVVLRHESVPFALQDNLWEKYKFGEMFKVQDPVSKAAAIRNPFWKPAPGTYKVPGIGPVPIGIDELQDSGVMFCVCDVAMTVYSAVSAGQMNLDPAEVKKEWLAGVLPNVQVVPSGVWAIGRAQEHGCAYCFAG